MFNPVATYRIQFNKEFTFKDFESVIPYLHELGIKTIYASPIYAAVPGSMHGYDVIDPNRINPEIGTLEELRAISALLKSRDMCWIQDIVPNHMGFHQQNLWLMDVLEKGEESVYRNYFDLSTADLSKEPLMVPFLGEDLETVIANGELELVNDKGRKSLKYFDGSWPLRTDLSEEQLSLSELADRQYYRLCSYKETNSRINYRRFFTVNSLICLNMQRREVFRDYHQLTHSLLKEGVFHGLRIDHVDGLGDPTGYLKQLRETCGEQVYILVEKILEPGEQLPRSWPVQGTTGYDYLGLVNQLFTNQKAEGKFDALYKDMGSFRRPVQEQVLRKKRAFLNQYMQGELNNLCQLGQDLGVVDRVVGNIDDEKAMAIFRQLVSEILVRLPVYRFYSTSYPLQEAEANALQSILDDLEKEGSYGPAVALFRDLLLGKEATGSKKDSAIVFYQRLMQFTGPLMAKGVEDTLMYTFNRFIGNNEVGDSPELFGISADEFHQQINLRGKYWPHAMNATATHDTKRGEDARARLAVLTDLRTEWIEQVQVWQEMNQGIKAAGLPDANDEYFIYQTLLATCPDGGAEEENYEQRLLEYIEKALRESKRNSDWDEPNLEYESRTKDFIQYLLDPQREFWPKFQAFAEKVSAFGKLASLSALVMKHTLPGIPDTYQGTEFWDLSLVDPDNRRAVDYQTRARSLSRTQKAGAASAGKTLSLPGDVDLKLQLLNRLLLLRKQNPDLFEKGSYVPLEVKGKHAAKVIAFARQSQGEWLIVVVAVNVSELVPWPFNDLTGLDWKDTHVVLPGALSGTYGRYMDALTGAELVQEQPGENVLELSALLKGSTVALRSISVAQKKRGAGVLMHVSSLPSAYGIGDFGPAATEFLSFLNDSGMKYWQVLPMNPLSAEQAYSPYSSTSVMAGNTLLISPEELAEDGLLSSTDLEKYKRKMKRKVSYAKVSELKNELLAIAYRNWKLQDSAIPGLEFDRFCQQESEWLEDYALFVLISRLEKNKQWFDWPHGLKNRDSAALKDVRGQYLEELNEVCWQQFIFFRQWKVLKVQANGLGIKIIGDLPFYAAHNSADVWTHQKLFALNADGGVKGIAGVPPDYFNADGQLWGMPVYNWKAMARNGYQWWTDRIVKNLEIYDQIRLDHFRAFSQYWEVPSGSETAQAGKWKPGPGSAFFKSLLAAMGELPLIAEDLGEISPEVYQLRDEFNLPGMKVLQFAFGEDMASSVHAPHNFENTNCIVYTGTHDNNTTQGWYRQEADESTRRRLQQYIGTKVTQQNAAMQMIRMALSSTADIAIIPMQDLLSKSGKNRMNTPASTTGNWVWRLKAEELSGKTSSLLRRMLAIYGR
jgi:malto-oligosyltrehalose synthase/4-alpha-glucanotransferase